MTEGSSSDLTNQQPNLKKNNNNEHILWSSQGVTKQMSSLASNNLLRNNIHPQIMSTKRHWYALSYATASYIQIFQ